MWDERSVWLAISQTLVHIFIRRLMGYSAKTMAACIARTNPGMDEPSARTKQRQKCGDTRTSIKRDVFKIPTAYGSLDRE